MENTNTNAANRHRQARTKTSSPDEARNDNMIKTTKQAQDKIQPVEGKTETKTETKAKTETETKTMMMNT